MSKERKIILKLSVNEHGNLESETIAVKNMEPVDYETLSKAVDGSIDIVSYCDFGTENVVAVVNDEGLLLEMEPTLYLLDQNYTVAKYPLVGNVILVKQIYTDDGYDLFGLTIEECSDALSSLLTYQGNYFVKLDQEYFLQKNEFIDLLKEMGVNVEVINMEPKL